MEPIGQDILAPRFAFPEWHPEPEEYANEGRQAPEIDDIHNAIMNAIEAVVSKALPPSPLPTRLLAVWTGCLAREMIPSVRSCNLPKFRKSTGSCGRSEKRWGTCSKNHPRPGGSWTGGDTPAPRDIRSVGCPGASSVQDRWDGPQ